MYGAVDETEMRCLYQRFQASTGGHAQMNRTKFSELMDMFVDRKKVPKNYYDFLFLAFDKDQRGFVTLKQLASTLGQLLRGSPDELKALAFSMIDFDQNGSMAADELFSLLNSEMGDIMKADLERLLDVLVSKYIGERSSKLMMLTYEEFAHAIPGRPHMLDVFRADAEDLLSVPMFTMD